MRKEALNSVRAAIEANTERRSIDQLKAQGKRHVRVVSGEKILEIIKAIVGDVVDREVGDISKRDRERIVSETKTQFDRVLKLQGDQDAVMREQKELLAEQKSKAERLQKQCDTLQEKLDRDRAEQTGREAKMLAEYQERLATLSEKQGSQAQLVSDLEGRLAKAKTTIQSYDDEIARRTTQSEADRQERELLARSTAGIEEARAEAEEAAAALERELEQSRARFTTEFEGVRGEAKKALEAQQAELSKLAARSEKDGELLERMKEALQAKEIELQRTCGERDTLRAELEAARVQVGESASVGALRGELAEMKSFLRTIDERSSRVDESTVQALLEQLSQRETVTSSAMEERFSATMDKTLDQIAKSMAQATAKPIDFAVEATDVLVAKFFDLDSEMTTNLEQLEVEVRTSKTGIGSNLARLKAMRAAGSGAPAAPSDTPPSDAPPAKDSASEAKAGPAAESAVVPDATRKKINSSMERLKAVREGAPAPEKE